MKHNGFEYVDLGLPSGTKWAKCNVGANSETDYGLYFACGGIVGVDSLCCENDFDSNKIRYDVREKATLHIDNDAAHIHMGGKWHMPTKEQFEELLDKNNTTSIWLYDYCNSGVSGRLFRSRINNETLFIPANGFINNNALYRKDVNCSIWTSSLDFSTVDSCICLFCSSNNASISQISAYYIGMGIRGVFNTFWMK